MADVEPVGKINPKLFVKEFNFVLDVEGFAEFGRDFVDGVIHVRVISTLGPEMWNDDIRELLLSHLFVILHPFHKQCFLPDTLRGTDDQWQIRVTVHRFSHPFLDLQEVFFQPACPSTKNVR